MTNSDLTVTSFERNGFVNLTLIKLSKHLLKTSIEFFFLDFYRASICEGGLVGRNSVCPSVRPSVCLLHAWIVTNLNGALQIFWYHTKGQSLCYSDTNSGWWATPLPSEICAQSDLRPFEKRRLRQMSAHNVSTVRDSEKSSIMTNIKSTTGFPTSYRWSAYVTRISPLKGGSKNDFFVFLSRSQRLIVSGVVNLVRRWVS